jgi:hypothetical protein
MKRGCLVCLLGLAAVVLGAASLIRLMHQWNDPYFRGRRLSAWADQAICDKDAARRQQAARVLTEALKGLKGHPRTELVMRFVHPPCGGQEPDVLPPEVVPFLLEALRHDEGAAQGYAEYALVVKGGPEAEAALRRVSQDSEADPAVREGAARVLGYWATYPSMAPSSRGKARE